MQFNFDNTYATQLKGFYALCNSMQAPEPKLIRYNEALAKQLGINLDDVNDNEKAAIFSGMQSIPGAQPLAQVYAGHQFGHYSPQLGDGRALLLGELIDQQGLRFDIQLKGSGRTPYSRGGDGKAALGPVLREYIMCEAMHALGIPTSRALAAVTTGEMVMRDQPLPGAMFTRVAASHIRVGTFQYFAAQGEPTNIQKLADYTIARHYPNLQQEDNPYLALLAQVCDAQASLISKWMLVGFIHGVMNTDNMTISGETIDYGPCAFMDAFSPETVYSSIDRQGRYAYLNQPPIAQWNLARFAETLLSLIHDDKENAVELAIEVVNEFPNSYNKYWLAGMRTKLGLTTVQDDDLEFVNELLSIMNECELDYSLTFRHLAKTLKGNMLISDEQFNYAKLIAWTKRWHDRLNKEGANFNDSILAMNRVNPLYIPRNHKVEEALEAATDTGDYSYFEGILNVLNRPYAEQAGNIEYSQPASKEFEKNYQTFCGT